MEKEIVNEAYIKDVWTAIINADDAKIENLLEFDFINYFCEESQNLLKGIGSNLDFAKKLDLYIVWLFVADEYSALNSYMKKLKPETQDAIKELLKYLYAPLCATEMKDYSTSLQKISKKSILEVYLNIL